MLPKKEENPQGLHQKYHVKKIEGETDPNAEYWVLRLDDGGKDPDHIEACRQAIIAYALSIKTKYPELANDIFDRYEKYLY